MNTKETEKLLRRLGACDEARNWAAGHTLAWAWEHCERGEWLEWLADALGVTMTAPAGAEYERVRAAAWAEYERVRAAAYRVAVPYEQIALAAKEN